MEIDFLFSVTSQRIKARVTKDQIIEDALNKIILKHDSLKNIEITFLLCSGCNIDKKETFENQKIKNHEIITVICSYISQDEEENKEIKPIQFKYVKKLVAKARVNLPNSDLNAFIDKTFDVFKSLKGQYLLICSYSDNYKNYDLLCFEITNEEILFIANNAHSERIFTCSHFLDKYNNRDLLITGSFDRTIKIWNINDSFQLLYKKRPDYKFVENTYLLSECLLAFNKSIYLIASAYEIYSQGYYMLSYNLNNLNKYDVMSNSKDNTNYLDTQYINRFPLIIAANCDNIKIFDFSKKKLIKTFSDNNKKINFLSVVIKKYKDKMSLISSSSDGFLRIWDYNNPNILIHKIQTYLKNWLIGLELIDNRFLLAGCADGSIKEFDLSKDYVAVTFPRNVDYDPLFTLRFIKINGKNYLFSHSHRGLIEMWN